MAKLLLSCDEYIYCHNGKYYAGSQEKYDFFQRYLRVFEELRIAVRCIDELSLKASRVELADPRIEVMPIPIFHGPKQYITKYCAVGKSTRQAVEGCDAAVLRLPSTVAQRISKQVLRKQIPFATEIVFDANDGAETANNIIEKVLWRIIDKQMRSTCAKANGVACVTEFYLQQRYFSKRADCFTSNYSTLALDKSFFATPKKYPEHTPLVIAHVSNQIGLGGRKGEANLIQALGILKREGIVINLKFAGDDWDDSATKIKKYAEKFEVAKQIECVGYLSRKELDIFLSNADLFVLPTKAEGLPRVIIEAIAKGLPTITTPASGNPELIAQELLVDYDDIANLAEKIKLVISNKNLYEQISRRNIEHSKQYEASILELRRDKFYTNLKNCIK